MTKHTTAVPGTSIADMTYVPHATMRRETIEECAKICDRKAASLLVDAATYPKRFNAILSMQANTAAECAAAIRKMIT